MTERQRLQRIKKLQAKVKELWAKHHQAFAKADWPKADKVIRQIIKCDDELWKLGVNKTYTIQA